MIGNRTARPPQTIRRDYFPTRFFIHFHVLSLEGEAWVRQSSNTALMTLIHSHCDVQELSLNSNEKETDDRIVPCVA